MSLNDDEANIITIRYVFTKKPIERNFRFYISENIFEICRNHFFDKKERNRTVAKRKSGKVSQPDIPSNRPSGVRHYHRCDESKIMAHQRKGMETIE